MLDETKQSNNRESQLGERENQLLPGEKQENKQEKIESENGAQVIIDFLKLDFDKKFPSETGSFIQEEIEHYQIFIEHLREFLKNKSFPDVVEVLGDEIIFIQDAILIYNEKLKEIESAKEEIEKLIEVGGIKMIPLRVRRILEMPRHILNYLTTITGKIEEEEYPERMKFFEEVLAEHKVEILQIKQDIFPEKVEKRLVQIKGFEKLDSSEIKAEELVKIALQILPQKLLGRNILETTYEDRIFHISSKKYGIEGNIIAEYSSSEKRIKFYKPDPKTEQETAIEKNDPRYIFFDELLVIISHEGGHTLDPRFISQEELSIPEEMEMLIAFEQVRNDEKEFSSYVLDIENEDIQVENFLKSSESFAEMITMFLISPTFLEEQYPKRFEFCKRWLERQFSEENFTTKTVSDDGNSYYTRPCQIFFQYDNLLEKYKESLK